MTYRGIDFNGDHGSGYYCNYWCNFTNSNWWKADRLLLLVQVPTQSSSADLLLEAYGTGIGGGTGIYADILTYSLDVNGYAIIDLTELARTYDPSTHYISVWYGQASEYQSATTILNSAAKGLINPLGVIIPDHPLKQCGLLIAPPHKMIQYTGFGSLIAEVLNTTTNKIFDAEDYSYSYPIEQDVINPTDRQLFCQIPEPSYIQLTRRDGCGTDTYRFEQRRCEAKYASVRWISFSGVERLHIFEVRKAKQSTVNAYELMNLEGEYTQIKGREDGFALYIDGLDAYDMWYYGDILQSSKVEVKVDEQGVYRRVKVTDNNITIPDGDGGNGKLEINIKFHEYDAVTV